MSCGFGLKLYRLLKIFDTILQFTLLSVANTSIISSIKLRFGTGCVIKSFSKVLDSLIQLIQFRLNQSSVVVMVRVGAIFLHSDLIVFESFLQLPQLLVTLASKSVMLSLLVWFSPVSCIQLDSHSEIIERSLEIT